jgi:hypothetical protein
MEEEENRGEEKELELGLENNNTMKRKDSLSEDNQFKHEFDNIKRELNNHHIYRGPYLNDKEVVQLSQINVRQSTEQMLVFRKLPFHIWIAGLVLIIVALYLIYHLALGQHGVLFDAYREGYWWQYLVSILVLIFGIVFMYAGKVE